MSENEFNNNENNQNIILSIEDNIENLDIDYNGYQVVRGEFFAHLYEPWDLFEHRN